MEATWPEGGPRLLDASNAERILVTGGAGFLGRVLVAQLLARTAATVVVFALPQEAVPDAWRATWGDRIEVVRGDITQAADVHRAAQACQVIFHLAAMVGDGGTQAQHERVTVGGTALVFQAARQSGAAVVLTTSICAYGDALQRGQCQEDTPPGAPQGPYSHAKQGQERLAWQFQAQGGRVCVVRPANIIGPGSGPWVLDAAQALRQGLPALVGGGCGVAGLTVVDNVADFLVLAAHHPQAWGRAFNVHDDLPITWRRYFEDLARVLGASPPRSVPRWLAYLGAAISEPVFRRLWPHKRPPVTREALNLIAWPNRFATQAARSLGWAPRVPYEQALEAIAQDMARRGR
jgi:2-alkyl-3-oxoalkanoate reductase